MFYLNKKIILTVKIILPNPMQIKPCLKIRRFEIYHNLATVPYSGVAQGPDRAFDQTRLKIGMVIGFKSNIQNLPGCNLFDTHLINYS